MPGQEFELNKETLSLEVLQRITLFLRNPVEKRHLGVAAKFLREAAYDAQYLRLLIIKHFPKYMSALEVENKENINWLEHYHLAFRDSFDKKPERSVEIFFKVKEGDLAGLQATNINFQDLLQEDNHGTALYEWARKLGHQDILDHFYSIAVKAFLNEQNEIDINRTIDKITILICAIICFQPLDAINQLITKYIRAQKEKELIDALSAATTSGNVEVVKQFFMLGLLSENIKPTQLRLLMPRAIACGHCRVVEEFLNTKCVEVTNEDFFQACESGHLDIVNLFLIHLKYKLTNSADLDSILLQAIVKSMSNDQDVIVEKLLFEIKNPQIINSESTPSLPRQAAQCGAFKVLKKLLDAPFAVDIHRADAQLTPLEIAVLAGHYHIVILLMNNGGIEKLPNKNVLPFLAVQSNSIKVVQLFVNKDNINLVNPDGNTLLHSTVGGLTSVTSSQMINIIRYLIELGVDANAVNLKNNTALSEAIQLQKSAAVSYLLSIKTITVKDPEKGFLYSVKVGNLEMMCAFLNYKPEVICAHSENNESALRLAVNKNYPHIIVELLIRGAAIDWDINRQMHDVSDYLYTNVTTTDFFKICQAIKNSKLSPPVKELLSYETQRASLHSRVSGLAAFEAREGETLAMLRSVILQNASLSTLEPYAEKLNSAPLLNKIYQNYLLFVNKPDEEFNINKKSVGPSL